MIMDNMIEMMKEMKKKLYKMDKQEYRDILVDNLIAVAQWRKENLNTEISDEAFFLSQIYEAQVIDIIYRLDHENKEGVNA